MMDNSHCLIKLLARPARGMMDEKMTILVQNAPPGLQLTIHGLHHCEEGHSWEAFGYYVADTLGNVDVSQDLSLGGTYSGVEPMGLLWSLRAVPGSRSGLRLRKMNVQTPLVLTISVYQGHQAKGFTDLDPLAVVEVERWYMAPGIRRIDVTEDGLTASIFLPPGPGPFPGVLDLWGAGGKLIEIRAALLASYGFASMALDYLTPRITIETGKMVDYDYFEKAYRALEKHPQVLNSRMAIIGASFGSSIALKMAAYSQIKPRCLVLIGGSHLAKRDGNLEETWKMCFQPGEKPFLNEKNEMILKHHLVPLPTDPQLKVEMGRIQCPVLSVLGDDDPNWPSNESAVDMKDMMERSGNSHLLTTIVYPKAGHLIEPPYTPHTSASLFKGKAERVMTLWGGETVAHSRAQEDCWRKILLFLNHHLLTDMKPGASPLSRL